MSARGCQSRARTYSIIAMGVLLLSLATSAHAYTYNNLGADGGWDDVEKGNTTSFVLDRSDYTQDSGLGEAQITSALQSAFGTWGSVKNSSLKFVEMSDDGGNYDLTDGPNDSSGPSWFGGWAGDSMDQGANYLYANITFGGWLPNDYFDYLEDGKIDGVASNILAVAWTGQVRGPLSRKPRWIADIFFNDGWTWSLDGDLSATTEVFEIDIETVMLHELGHAIGLGHEDDVSSVMDTFYSGIERDLYQDDIDGLLSLYSGGTKKGRGKPGGGKGKLTFFYADEYAGALQNSAEIVPEPATMLMLAMGGLALLRRRSGFGG